VIVLLCYYAEKLGGVYSSVEWIMDTGCKVYLFFLLYWVIPRKWVIGDVEKESSSALVGIDQL